MATSSCVCPWAMLIGSPAKEVADAVKAAQKKSGSSTKMKVTVCEALEGEAGDILFFPAKESPSAFRAAALTAAGIEWVKGLGLVFKHEL